MLDFNIRRGLSSVLFSEPGVVNPRLAIEEGCWYLCTDTAELFLGINTESGLTLKRINEVKAEDFPTQTPTEGEVLVRSIIDAFVGEDGMLHLVYSDDTEDVLGPVVGKDGKDGQNGKDGISGKDGADGKDGLTTAVKVNGVVYEHTDGVITLPDFITEHQSLEGLATEEYVDKKIAEAELADKDVDLSNYYSKSEVDTKFDSIEHPAVDLTDYAKKSDLFSKDYNDLENKPKLFSGNYEDLNNRPVIPEAYNDTEVRNLISGKADEIPFKSAKFVTKPIGNFANGDNINGLTIAEILAKLLELTDEKPSEKPSIPEVPGEDATPEEIVAYLVSKQSTMYSQDEAGNLVETPFAHNTWTEEEAAAQMSGISTIYNIEDDSGNIIESGYQEATDYNEEAWLTVALPSEIKNVKVKIYDPDVKDWVDVVFDVVPAEEQTMAGYTIWTVPEDYEIMSGDTFRFVIV